MTGRIGIWFAALTKREQWLVATGALLAGLVLSVYAIILPTLAAIDRARSEHDMAVERRGRIVATVEAARAIGSPRKAAQAADITLVITQSAAEKGFDVVKSANATPGQISIRIDQARAPALLSWLTELENQNVAVRGVTLRSGANGSVTVDAQLQMRAQ
jgi:type II secretory pathway component PulM